jgi:hypothetical protein
MLTARLTLHALYLPLPPSAPPPFLIACLLSPSLLPQHMVSSHQSKILSPAFSSAMIFHFSLMNMPIIYIEEIETTLLTRFGCILGFIEGKGR